MPETSSTSSSTDDDLIQSVQRCKTMDNLEASEKEANITATLSQVNSSLITRQQQPHYTSTAALLHLKNSLITCQQ